MRRWEIFIRITPDKVEVVDICFGDERLAEAHAHEVMAEDETIEVGYRLAEES